MPNCEMRSIHDVVTQHNTNFASYDKCDNAASAFIKISTEPPVLYWVCDPDTEEVRNLVEPLGLFVTIERTP